MHFRQSIKERVGRDFNKEREKDERAEEEGAHGVNNEESDVEIEGETTKNREGVEIESSSELVVRAAVDHNNKEQDNDDTFEAYKKHNNVSVYKTEHKDDKHKAHHEGIHRRDTFISSDSINKRN